MKCVKKIFGIGRDVWVRFTSASRIRSKLICAYLKDQYRSIRGRLLSNIFKATIWFEVLVLLVGLVVILMLTACGKDSSSGWNKLAYDVCLNLMAASFLTLCIEVIGMKLSYRRTRADEANSIIRGAAILHSAIENYVSAHLDLSFGKMEDLQKWFFGNQQKRFDFDGVYMMRDDFAPSELARMFSQTIFLFSGISSKPVYTYLNRETELRNTFEKIYFAIKFDHYVEVRDTILEFITVTDNDDCKIAIEESMRVRFGNETEAENIIKNIKSGYFEQYVRDIESGKKKMTANSMNPYAILYWKMKKLRNILIKYELAVDKVRKEVKNKI